MPLPRPVLSAAGARCGTSKLGLTSGLTVPSSPLYQGRTYAPHATRRATASIHTRRAAHDSPDARGCGRSAGDDSEPRHQGLRGITCADVATRGSQAQHAIHPDERHQHADRRDGVGASGGIAPRLAGVVVLVAAPVAGACGCGLSRGRAGHARLWKDRCAQGDRRLRHPEADRRHRGTPRRARREVRGGRGARLGRRRRVALSAALPRSIPRIGGDERALPRALARVADRDPEEGLRRQL